MNNLKLNKDKCQFGVTEVTFLGDRLTQNGVQPDVEKVIAIQEMPQPSSVKELQRFLGMVTSLGSMDSGSLFRGGTTQNTVKQEYPMDVGLFNRSKHG